MIGDDGELLRRYAAEGCEEAFGEVVRRHVDLVYATALRRLAGERTLAEDVTQTVFQDLAKKAGTLCRHPVLSGWLYKSACFAANRMARGESRRRRREEEAIRMSENAEGNGAEIWAHIAPELDAAMLGLSGRDREAVLLRYFEGRRLGEIGSLIGVSENAARMRVERALERLRVLLGKRGVVSSAGVLAAALGAQGISAAPAGLAGTVAAAATVSGAGALTVATTITKFMTLSKIQVGAISAAIAAGVATPVALWQRSDARLRGQILELQRQVGDAARSRTEVATAPAANEIAGKQAELERAELIRLRGEVAGLRRDAQELAQERAELAKSQAALQAAKAAKEKEGQAQLAEGLVPALSWKNIGMNTPADAYETLHWAKNYGQVQMIARTLDLGTGAKAKADALYATLPDELREKFKSSEEMMAGFFMNSTPVAGMRVLEQTPEGADDAKLRVQYQYVDGRVREDTVDMHRYPDGWRQTVEPAVVDKMGRNLTEMIAARPAKK